MEIRVDEPGAEQRNVAVTMRTPGHDFELAAGFLFTEGLIAGQADVRNIRYCAVPSEEQHYNVVSVSVARTLAFETQRNFYATSSCGICGKASLDMIDVQCAPIGDGPVVRGRHDHRPAGPAPAGTEAVRPDRRLARRRALRSGRAPDRPS